MYLYVFYTYYFYVFLLFPLLCQKFATFQRHFSDFSNKLRRFFFGSFSLSSKNGKNEKMHFFSGHLTPKPCCVLNSRKGQREDTVVSWIQVLKVRNIKPWTIYGPYKTKKRPFLLHGNLPSSGVLLYVAHRIFDFVNDECRWIIHIHPWPTMEWQRSVRHATCL